ncbi:HAMP domain-containing sensor histidine kinase [Salinicoccus halodurans]|uniref:Signal transduction histidine-protein kinase ArlS n=1 Tax=Salinicoccus halodurans TaxID=407035 RepID=A0A0F7HM06_9STAP|nr:HAMP domain-containing histidine kinase [Salinicoccus halodurans]AKG74123.1 histidine kinase [Salinicoccus halodurans]SFK60795.1 two-component system, OmpR family, sensor histidine kinase ArlS [Salinicoccus halodurans]
MNKNSLKYRWLKLSTLIITITYLIFSSLLIYFTSVYLKDQEDRSLKRSLEELESLYESQPINTIGQNEIYSSLYDRQKMILYTQGGDVVYSATTGVPMDLESEFEPVHEREISQMETDETSYLIGRVNIESQYWSGYLSVIHPLDSYNAVIRMMMFIAIIVGFLSILFTSIISYFFSTQMVKPIRSIANQLKRIESEGFSERLKLSTNTEETDYMVDSFNHMMDSLEESYNQQKQFVEDASHELRTPLQIIQGHLKLISRWGKHKPEVLDESLNISIDELKRINKLVEELLLLTKNDGKTNDTRDEIDINAEIRSRVNSMQKVHPDYTFSLDLDSSPIHFTINSYHLEQMLIIFLDNAIKYDTENKHIIVTSEKKEDYFDISILDHGIGIPKDEIEAIFNRFYRVDKSRSRQQGGNGLGLSIAKKLIENYKGNVWLESAEGKFTKVTIRFPL